jgi:hypothetical protein
MNGILTITIHAKEYKRLKEYEKKYKRFVVYNIGILVLWIILAIMVCIK